MRKIRVIFIFLVILGCQEKRAPQTNTEEELRFFNYQKLPKKLEVNPNVVPILEGWQEYSAMNSSIDVLHKATNTEDLSLAIDDLLEKERELSKGVYPEPFNSFQVKSRQQVFRTFLLKVRASILNKSDATEPTIEMLEAYNTIRQQFNNILNSQLDTKLILDEEE